MSWFLIALGSAAGVATADFLLKRHFSDRPVTEMALARFAGLTPLCLLLLIFMPWPQVRPDFWWALALALPGEAVAALLYQRALKVSPLALCQPFLSFTPLFAVLTGGLFLGELPTGLGMMGVAFLAAGAYSLNLEEARHGWWGPLAAVAREPGSWMMLLVSAIYAYTAVLGRVMVLASGPLFVLAVYPLAFLVVMTGVLGAAGRLTWGWARKPGPAVAVALAMTLMAVCHFVALGMVQTAYMMSVKRLSVLMVMVYGAVFLGEDRLAQHLGAGALMVAGSALVLLFG